MIKKFYFLILYLKKLLLFLFIYIFFVNSSNAAFKYKLNQKISGDFNITNRISIPLPKGEWKVIYRSGEHIFRGIHSYQVSLAQVSNNNVILGNGIDNEMDNSLVLGNVSDGDIFTCTAYVEDANGASDSISDSIVIANINTPPIVDSVSLSPTVVYTNDTITATGSFSDVDVNQNLTATYAWYVIDFDTGISILVQSGTNNTLDGVSYFDRDDEIYVVVTANDGTVDSIPYTSSMLSVSNSAPVIDNLTITPNGATAGEDDLICEVVATDIDGENVEYTYQWSDPDGVVQQSTGPTAEIFDVYLGSGTTIMHEGFVNFNAGSLGEAMIEGRISQGVVIGDKTDIGGGASTMGTLSGGNDVRISLGKNCLLGANSGLGIPLGDRCTVEAGLYLTASSKVEVINDKGEISETVKASELASKSDLLFIRNSLTGSIQCRPNKKIIELNEELHSND